MEIIKQFSWEEVKSGARALTEKIFREFNPDVFLSVSVPGTIIANLMAINSPKFIPFYAGIPFAVDNSEAAGMLGNQYVIETPKRNVAIPHDVFRYASKKILIIDNAVVTGGSIEGAFALLRAEGFREENIRTATLLVADDALRAQKGSDFYWSTIPTSSNVYMPWGNLLGEGDYNFL